MTRLLVAAAAVTVLGATVVAAGTQPAPTRPAQPTQIVHTVTGDDARYAELHRSINVWRACRDNPSPDWPCGNTGGSR